MLFLVFLNILKMIKLYWSRKWEPLVVLNVKLRNIQTKHGGFCSLYSKFSHVRQTVFVSYSVQSRVCNMANYEQWASIAWW